MTNLREDEAQIAEVLVRYATGIDRRDWPLFRTCWTEDVEADYGAAGSFSGVDEITEFMVRSHERMGDTHHRMSNFAIEVDGDTAKVRSYVHAVLVHNNDDPSKWIDVIGHYDDDFVRTPNGWCMRRRICRISRLLTNGTSTA